MSYALFHKKYSILYFLLILTLSYFFLLYAERLLIKIRGQEYLPEHTHDLARRWGKSLFSMVPGWALEVFDLENLPGKEQSYIVVANHESATDILAVYTLNINFRWLAKKEIFRLPLIGTAMRWAGYVPIKRGSQKSHHAALEQCKGLLRLKVPILFFQRERDLQQELLNSLK